jgi:hypothetical protein
MNEMEVTKEEGVELVTKSFLNPGEEKREPLKSQARVFGTASEDPGLSQNVFADPEATLRAQASEMREDLRQIEVQTRRLRDLEAFKMPDKFLGQHGEMIAQSMLAVRAIEEARMRLGKVLQYAGDGVSIYEKA